MKKKYQIFMVALTILGFVKVQAMETTLGLSDGVYIGKGKLEFPNSLLPNLSFRSVRKIHNGEIEVQTEASKFGISLGSARARLKVITIDSTRFELWDLDTNGKAGEGSCSDVSCTFEASVMSNKEGVSQLFLRETWVPSANGFQLLDGYQNLKGRKAIYTGIFLK